MKQLKTCAATIGLMAIGLVSPALAQDGSFLRGNSRLHYRTTGTGTPIILLSGGPGFDADYMASVGALFPDSFQRVIYDQRGIGRSRAANQTPGDFTLRAVVDDLEALRIHLKQARLFLVGHSWGGMLAMAYAATYPEQVDRLVLIDSGGPTLEFMTWFGDNIRARLRPEDLEAEKYWDAALDRGFDLDKGMNESASALIPAYFYDRAKGLAFAQVQRDGGFNALANDALFTDLGKSYDLRPALRRIDRPVLIIQGHQDPIGDKTAEDIHALLRNSTLTYINKAGHFPWLEQPDDFKRAIFAFCGPPDPTAPH